MGKFKNLRKKLMAGLCAFASGVGGAKAVVDDVNFSAPIVTHTNDCYCLGDGTPVDHGVIDKIANFATDVETCVSTQIGNKRFALQCIMWSGNRTLTVRIAEGSEEGDKVLFSFDVSLAYIVNKLGISSQNLGNVGDIGGFLDKNIVDSTNDGATKTVRFKLTKLILFNVLGITQEGTVGIYGSATQNPNDYSDANYDTPLTDNKHPDFAGCFARYIKKDLLSIPNAIDYEDDKVKTVNQKIIWEHFFGTPGKPNTQTDYYKTMEMNPGWPKSASVLFTIAGVAALVEGGYIALDELYLKPREREDVSMEIAGLESRIKTLAPRAKLASQFEKAASQTLVGKKILKKILGGKEKEQQKKGLRNRRGLGKRRRNKGRNYL